MTKKQSKTRAKIWRDPIVEEIRTIRERHAKKFNYDLDAIFADLKELEVEFKTRRKKAKTV